jgi:AI-2 transport protein TqsA
MAIGRDPAPRLLAVLAVIAVVAALKVSQPVTMPLVAAGFILVLLWPLHARLQAVVPRTLAYATTILIVLLALAGFAFLVGWSLSVIIDQMPQISERVQELRERLTSWANDREVTVPEGEGGVALETVAPIVTSVWQWGAMLLLTIAFLALALAEVDQYRNKLVRRLGDAGKATVADIGRAGGKVRGFFLALSISGLLSGVASALFGWAIGIDHVLVWAALALLLNYIPIVGPVVAIFPPTLWALVQFDTIGRPLAVLAGFGVIQFVTGNYIAPKFEGRYTDLSPLVVLLSIVLWGWIWGPIGAVLAVPITIGVVLASRHLESTRWIAVLLSERS